MIYIVPTYGRPHVLPDLLMAWSTSRTSAELHLVVDQEDPQADAYRVQLKDAPDWVHWSLVPSRGMAPALHRTARMDAARAEHHLIGFMGDDHRPRTPGWDQRIEEAWRAGGRVIYANDLLQGANLPTQVALDARIVRRLGYMAPPVLRHLYLDNFWLQLGTALGALTYLPDVVIEHMHPVAGKAEWDEGYRRVNGGDIYAQDGDAFTAYLRTGGLQADLVRIGDLR